jgi:cyclic pyranopterin phosphate synthase
MNRERSAPRRPDLRDRLSRPMTDLRISVIDSCNFRCTYCMPREKFGDDYVFLSQEELLSFDEIERLVRILASLGVTTVRLTGGEPLLRQWLPSLIERILAVPSINDCGLTTNGYHLAAMAGELYEAGLRRVTVSLDSLDDRTWGRINGRGYPVDQIMKGIDAAAALGFNPVKINMVVQRGVNDGEIMEMIRTFRRSGFHLRFIEYMDVGNINGWQREKVVPSDAIRRMIASEYPMEPIDPARRGCPSLPLCRH